MSEQSSNGTGAGFFSNMQNPWSVLFTCRQVPPTVPPVSICHCSELLAVARMEDALWRRMLALTQDTIKSSSALACDQMMQESIACVQASKLAAALSRGATAESSINMMRQLDQLDMTHRILETTELMPQIKTLCTYPDPKLQGLVRCSLSGQQCEGHQ